jgi:hypothetical protein
MVLWVTWKLKPSKTEQRSTRFHTESRKRRKNWNVKGTLFTERIFDWKLDRKLEDLFGYFQHTDQARVTVRLRRSAGFSQYIIKEAILVYTWGNIQKHSCKYCRREKAIIVCVCVRAWDCVRACSLIYPHAKLVPPPYVASLATPLFPTLSLKRQSFRKKKVTDHKMCVLISSTTFTWNIAHSRKNLAR